MMRPAPKPVKRPSDSAGSLSELEGAVLGLVLRHGPMTAHAIRKTFLDSPTSHFSGSAGSIYPLVRRLTAEGLLEASGESAGAKGGEAFVVTDAGREAMRGWLLPEDPSWMASVTFDPLRTRVLVLGILSKRERDRFLECAEAELEASLREQQLRADEACGDAWERAAISGAIAMSRARLRWIRSLRSA